MIMGEGGLSAQERLMLMTMIDINNGVTLYEQARHNMMKIMTGAKEDDNLRFFKAFICIFSISLQENISISLQVNSISLQVNSIKFTGSNMKTHSTHQKGVHST